MALINLTQAEMRELSKKYDDKKRKFEKALIRDLTAMFGAMSDELYISITQQDMGFNFDIYLSDIESLLLKHYKKSGFDFAENLKRLMKEQPKGNPQLEAIQEVREDFSEAILLALLLFYKKLAKDQAKIIVNTSNRIYNDVRSKVFNDMISQGVVYDRRRMAKEIAIGVNARNKSRIPTIAETEIGKATSAGSQQEINTVSEVVYGFEDYEPRKVWNTVGDGRVRNAHAGANFQKRKYDELYIVGGERLMYPRDSAHGASVWNTINCRCNSIEVI